MSTTGERTLQLLLLLQNHRHWLGGDLADRLGVSGRTLRRDVDRLRSMGYPVDARRGVDGGYALAPGASLPPLVLDDEEAVALAVGMQVAVRSGAVIGIEDSSVTALAKIVQVLPRRLRPQVDAVAAMTESVGWGDAPPSIDSWVLTSIAQACRDCERLTFAYVARDGSPTERSVDPHRLVLLGRRWYLVAWDLDRSDWRIFRLDRLETEHRTGRNFTPRPLPKGDAAQFVRASLDRAPTGHEIEVVVHAAASEVRNRVGRWGTVEKVDSARCLLRMTAESLDWPMMALSAIGAEFEVVSPHALIQHLRERADLFGRAAAKQ